jgi:hypothetical protein
MNKDKDILFSSCVLFLSRPWPLLRGLITDEPFSTKVNVKKTLKGYKKFKFVLTFLHFLTELNYFFDFPEGLIISAIFS